MVVTMCLKFDGYRDKTMEFDRLRDHIFSEDLLKRYAQKFDAQKVIATLDPPPYDSFSAHAYLKFYFSVDKNTEEGKRIIHTMNNANPVRSLRSPDEFWLYLVENDPHKL